MQVKPSVASGRALAVGGLPALAGLLAIASACYPSSVTNVSQYSTVTTLYDTAFNEKGGFQTLTTYSIPGATPSNPGNCAIEDLADGGPFFSDAGSPYQASICNTLVNQFNDLGYTLINPMTGPNAPQPSFVVNIVGLNQSYTAWVTYPWYGYWGGYYPFYPWGGWGYYYPWGPTFVYNFNVGTIEFTMATPVALPDGGSINAIWAGALNGVLSTNVTPASVAAGIEQAFNQSPYLGAAQ